MRKFAVPMLLLGAMLFSGSVFAAQGTSPTEPMPTVKHEMKQETKTNKKMVKRHTTMAKHKTKKTWHHAKATKHTKKKWHASKRVKHAKKVELKKPGSAATNGGM